MTGAEVGGIVRTILAAIGGAVALKYGVDGATVEALAGGFAVIATAVWSIWQKRATGAAS